MHLVQFGDQLYQQAQRRAAAAGFSSVDEYVADIVKHDISTDAEEFGLLFTQERLAHIDAAAAEMDAGQGLTLEQADALMLKRRAKWLRQNPR